MGGEGQDGLAHQGGQVRRLRQQDRGEAGQEEDPQVGAQEYQEARRRPPQEGPGDLDRRGDREGGLRAARISARNAALEQIMASAREGAARGPSRVTAGESSSESV